MPAGRSAKSIDKWPLVFRARAAVMIFGILLGIVLFVVISVVLLALYIAFKRYCSDKKTLYGFVNHDTGVKHGRLYPMLNFKDDDNGGSASTAPCLDDVDSPHNRSEEGRPDGHGNDHKEDLDCTLVECEKEPDYVVPSSLPKPYAREGDTSPSSWNYVQPGSSTEGGSHINNGFHSTADPHVDYIGHSNDNNM